MDADLSTAPIAIVGLLGGEWFGHRAEQVLRRADVLIGHAEQFALLAPDITGERVELWGDLGAVVDRAVDERAAGRQPCILAAGDPGFHGMVRFAARRLGEDGIAVHPAPSSVALAFARVGTSWDDAVVASAYAEQPDDVVAAVLAHAKVAVLVSRRLPPRALGVALIEAGCSPRSVTICTRLGEPDEQIIRTDLAGLAGGDFAHLSVVVLQGVDGRGDDAGT